MSEKNNNPQKFKTYLKKIGVVGFLFFLIKGLVWIALFYGLWDKLKDLF
jgi:hypothetical protein